MFRSARDMVRVRNKDESNDLQEEKYFCDMCSSEGWYSETEVEIHKHNTHKKELKAALAEEDVCGLCCISFGNEVELLKHLKSEHLYSSEEAYRVEREIFICNDCCQIFFNKLHLIIHITKHHGGDKQKLRYVHCPHCKNMLKCRHISLHAHKHMIQSISSCKLCFVKCKNRKHLKEHLKSHGNYFKCDMCGYSSKYSHLFNKHIREMHKQKSGTSTKFKRVKQFFIPNTDPPIGKSQILMIYRGLSITNGIKICILCREICVGYDEMTNHILNEHALREVVVKNEYKCSCGELFSNKVLLKHHIFKLKGDHRIFDLEEEQSS